MPRYLIERTYTVDMDGLPTVATRSKAIGHYHYPEIVWEHSHVVVGSTGRRSRSASTRRRTRRWFASTPGTLGDHIVETIYEIAGDVSPADFPLTDAHRPRPRQLAGLAEVTAA